MLVSETRDEGSVAASWGMENAMARIVIVATAAEDRDVVAKHVDPEDELVVVVPAVEQSRLEWLANDEDGARAEAEAVGTSIANAAPPSDAVVEVKPEVPSQAVLDAVAEHDPERVIVFLHAGADATWLEDDEIARIPTEIAGVPVTLVEV